MKKMLPFMLLAAASMIHAQDQLFISEIADPGDEYTARFVELYNAGAEPVDLESHLFFLARQVNGVNWSDVQLTGSIGAGQTYVIGGSAFESWYGFAPDIVSGIVSGNGDDAYVLFEGGDAETGLIFDIYGVEDEDGTDQTWEYENSRAVRGDHVNDARILWDHDEWVITPADYTDCDPGTHLGSVPQNPAQPEGSIAIVSDTVEWGELVNIQVAVGELTSSDDIISFQFDLNYDIAVLEFVGYTLDDLMTAGGTAAVNSGIAGALSFSYMDTDPIVGSGAVVTFQFNARMIGSSDLDLSNAFLNNAPVETVIDGTLLIAEVSPPTGTLSFTEREYRVGETVSIMAAFDEAMDPGAPVILGFSGGFSDTEAMNRISPTSYELQYTIPQASGSVVLHFESGSDLWGNSVIPEPLGTNSLSILALLQGDVNDDGLVLAYDAALTLQHSVGLDPLPLEDPLPWESWRFQTSDVDGDGQLSAYDAGLILQFSAGLISSFGTSGIKAAQEAGVLVTLENSRLKFYPRGEVIGVDLEVPGGEAFLGEPETGDKAYHTAINIDPELYRFGICSATPFDEERPFMEIPLKESGRIEMKLQVNAKQSSLMMDVVVGLDHAGVGPLVKVYPNPAKSHLTVSGFKGESLFEVMDHSGRVILSQNLHGAEQQIRLDGLSQGLYIYRITGQELRLVDRFLKQ